MNIHPEQEPKRPQSTFAVAFAHLLEKDYSADDHFNSMAAARLLHEYSENPTPANLIMLHRSVEHATPETERSIRRVTSLLLKGSTEEALKASHAQGLAEIIESPGTYSLLAIKKAVQLAYEAEEWQLAGSVDVLEALLDRHYGYLTDEDNFKVPGYRELRAMIKHYRFFLDKASRGVGDQSPL